MKLPKDLEALCLAMEPDEDSEGPEYDALANQAVGINIGAQAVLEHEMIKKLEEALEWCSWKPNGEIEAPEHPARRALAELRAWKDGNASKD